MTGDLRALPLLLAMLVGLCLAVSPVLAGGNGNGAGQGNSGNAGSNAGGNGKSNAGGNGKSNAGGNGTNSGADVEDSNVALGLREAGRIHPLTDAYAAAENRFGGEVIDATLADNAAGGWTYELRLVTDDGRVRTLSYDATTLALLTIDGRPTH